jgi:hypothetical protein
MMKVRRRKWSHEVLLLIDTCLSEDLKFEGFPVTAIDDGLSFVFFLVNFRFSRL